MFVTCTQHAVHVIYTVLLLKFVTLLTHLLTHFRKFQCLSNSDRQWLKASSLANVLLVGLDWWLEGGSFLCFVLFSAFHCISHLPLQRVVRLWDNVLINYFISQFHSQHHQQLGLGHTHLLPHSLFSFVRSQNPLTSQYFHFICKFVHSISN